MNRSVVPEEVYRELTGKKLSAEQLARFHRIQRGLNIFAGDAIWAMMIALEFYDDCFMESARLIVLWAKIVSALLIIIIILLLRLIFIN